MKLKRLIAFLIMVFVLSGCMNDDSNKVTLSMSGVERVSLSGRQFVYKNKAQSIIEASGETTLLEDEVVDYLTKKKTKQNSQQKNEALAVFASLKEKSDATQYKKEEVVEEVPKVEPVIAEFRAKATLYGMDCAGCYIREDGSARTATGVALHPTKGVLQSDGTWLEGITYDGYYIIAADASIPFYSIIELENHGIRGMGISPDQPIRCIVLDRGGAISKNKIDFYIGPESNFHNRVIRNDGREMKAKIIRYGK